MSKLIPILFYVLWLMFSFLEGKREAFYFSAKMKLPTGTVLNSFTSKGDNEHVLFTIQRSVVLLILSLGLCLFNSISGLRLDVITISACICAFSFIHDGEYYTTRNYLDGIYPKKWFDQSTTSTALTDKFSVMTPLNRSVLFIVSIILIVISLI